MNSFLKHTSISLIAFSFLAVHLFAESEESETPMEEKEKNLVDKDSVKSFSSSQLQRNETIKDYPLRLDIFRSDKKTLLLHWDTSQKVDFRYFLIQEGQLKSADEKKQEFSWETIQALQGKLRQWRIQSETSSHDSQKYLRIVGVPEKGEAFSSYPVLYSMPPTLPAHSRVRLYADRIESRSIQISWTPPAASAMDAVAIERSSSTSGQWRQVGLLAHGGRIFQDRFLDPNTEYQYRVRSTNEESPWQSESLRVRTLR